MASGVYQIVNLFNMKIYIGFAKCLRTRKNTHFSELALGKHKNGHLQNAYNLYGKHYFKFEILLECEEDKLAFWEDYWVKVLKTNEREFGYNIQITDPNKRYIVSEETKEKLRIINKGRKHTPETIKKMTGVKKFLTEEGKRKRIESYKNRVLSEKQLISLKINRDKYVDSLRGKPGKAKGDIHMRKMYSTQMLKVLNVETGEIFESIIEAYRQSGLSISFATFSIHLRKYRKNIPIQTKHNTRKYKIL